MPVLDEREILQLAQQIASGHLPAEAFYRAPLYPALLALPLWAGLEPGLLPLLARALNGCLHLSTAALAFVVAGRLWGSRAAQYTTAALIGFNPVLLHFAGDALDITCAMTLLMLGIAALIPGDRGPPHWTRVGGWCALSALARPQLLAVVVALPILVHGLTAEPQARRRALFAAWALPLCVFLTLGLLNLKLAGEFRILPWQGAYNFWSANRPGANGRYFEQTLVIQTVDEAANTARIEGDLLYRRATGDVTGDYRPQIAYWQHRTLQTLAVDPARWVTLLLHKAFYLMNNMEQYNNKTYAFHKARSPWLRYNPLGWSMLLGLGVLGAARAWNRREIRGLVLLAGAYAGGTLLYYVSDRFRAPLVIFAALLAGGAWAAAGATQDRRPLWLALMVTALSLIPIGRADRTQTYVQDYLALGRAHSELHEYAAAQEAATQAIARAPDRPATQALLCITRFNAWLMSPRMELTPETLRGWTETCQQASVYSPTARRLLGYWEWRAGARDAGRQHWQALVDEDSGERVSALAWLVLSGALRPADKALLREATRFNISNELLQLALAYQGDPRARAVLTDHYITATHQPEFESLRRLFGPPREGTLSGAEP